MLRLPKCPPDGLQEFVEVIKYRYEGKPMLHKKLLNNFVSLRPVNEWRAITLARAHTRQYLFGRAIVARAKLYTTS